MPHAATEHSAGVTCPRCGAGGTRVTNTRRAPGRVKRYRRCRGCGRRFTTVELPAAGWNAGPPGR